MNIYLIRHCESQGNVDASLYSKVADHAIPLSDTGREQARAASMSPEWFEEERNPNNCAIRLIDDGGDQGFLFDGF